MPVIGQTRTLPQSLDTLWARLREVAAELGKGNASGDSSGKPPHNETSECK